MPEIQKVKRMLYINSRMELEFFMYLPSGIRSGAAKNTLSVNVNPLIYLRYKPPKNVTQEYDYTKAAYKITPKNLYSVIKFFNTVMRWFYEEKYNDLFLVNEDDKLVFNADYKNLTVKTPRGDYDTGIMQAIPTIVYIGDKEYEGIKLYVNQSIYCISLTTQEVEIIFNLLKDFKFSDEINTTLTCAKMIMTYGLYNQEKENHPKTPFD